jgi:serine/threonine protein kinase
MQNYSLYVSGVGAWGSAAPNACAAPGSSDDGSVDLAATRSFAHDGHAEMSRKGAAPSSRPLPSQSVFNDTRSFVKSVPADTTPQCPPTPARTPAWAASSGAGAAAVRRSLGASGGARGSLFFGTALRRVDSLTETKVLVDTVTRTPSEAFGAEQISGCASGALTLDQLTSHDTMDSVHGASGGCAAPGSSAAPAPPGLMSAFRRVTPQSGVACDGDNEISFDRDFRILRHLGQGSFSRVMEVVDFSSPRRFAVKRALNRYISRRNRNAQISEILSYCRVGPHPNLIDYRRAWQENGYIYFQMELCAGGTLRQIVADSTLVPLGGGAETPAYVPERLIWSLLGHVGSALCHLHAGGIVHLDVKPENVILGKSDGKAVLKLGDLGLSLDHHVGAPVLFNLGNESCETSNSSEVQGDASMMQSAGDEMEGDSRYMAPELLGPGGRAPPADLFSLGMTAFELAWDVGLPSDGVSWHDVREERIPEPAPYLCRSRELVQVIYQLLRADPQCRPTAQALLSHPRVQAACIETDPHLAARMNQVEFQEAAATRKAEAKENAAAFRLRLREGSSEKGESSQSGVASVAAMPDDAAILEAELFDRNDNASPSGPSAPRKVTHTVSRAAGDIGDKDAGDAILAKTPWHGAVGLRRHPDCSAGVMRAVHSAVSRTSEEAQNAPLTRSVLIFDGDADPELSIDSRTFDEASLGDSSALSALASARDISDPVGRSGAHVVAAAVLGSSVRGLRRSRIDELLAAGGLGPTRVLDGLCEDSGFEAAEDAFDEDVPYSLDDDDVADFGGEEEVADHNGAADVAAPLRVRTLPRLPSSLHPTRLARALDFSTADTSDTNTSVDETAASQASFTSPDASFRGQLADATAVAAAPIRPVLVAPTFHGDGASVIAPPSGLTTESVNPFAFPPTFFGGGGHLPANPGIGPSSSARKHTRDYLKAEAASGSIPYARQLNTAGGSMSPQVSSGGGLMSIGTSSDLSSALCGIAAGGGTPIREKIARARRKPGLRPNVDAANACGSTPHPGALLRSASLPSMYAHGKAASSTAGAIQPAAPALRPLVAGTLLVSSDSAAGYDWMSSMSPSADDGPLCSTPNAKRANVGPSPVTDVENTAPHGAANGLDYNDGMASSVHSMSMPGGASTAAPVSFTAPVLAFYDAQTSREPAQAPLRIQTTASNSSGRNSSMSPQHASGFNTPANQGVVFTSAHWGNAML